MIQRLFPGASKSLLAANAHDYGEGTDKAPARPAVGEKPNYGQDNAHDTQLQKPEERPRGEERNASAGGSELERRAPASAVGAKKAKGRDIRRFLVSVESRRRRLIDEDNLCEKFVVDCCRYSGLLPGDGPGQTKIEVCQVQVGKEGEECTVVEISEIDREGRAGEGHL